jgi:hypothetical protein
MPAELLSRINLDLLYAPFLETLLHVLADCRAAGHEYCATRGYASWPEQDALYAQGRTAPGHVVTHARAGESAHNYGLAVDFFAVKPRVVGGALVPDWGLSAYEELGRVAGLHGLLWGGTWTVLADRPHVQLPRYVWPSELAPLRVAYQRDTSSSPLESLRRAWAVIDS